MSRKIKEILLPEKIKNEFSDLGNSLKYLNHINLFLGTNNSGKSRFIRSLISELDTVRHIDNNINSLKVDQSTTEFLQNYERIENMLNNNGWGFTSKIDFDEHINKLSRRSYDFEFFETLFEIAKKLIEATKNPIAFFSRINSKTIQHIAPNRFSKEVSKLGINISQDFNDIKNSIEGEKISMLYIPILRGLRPIQNRGEGSFSFDDSYQKRTMHDYFSKEKTKELTIFTGLDLYDYVKECLLGSKGKRDLIRDFEIFLQNNFFTEEVSLIPRIDDDVIHVKIGDNEFPISELGDGIQSIIILTFQLFINKKKRMLVFIEEPEIHLHPSWQKLLFETFLTFENHQFFISTHSNAFINNDNVSLYKVSNKEKQKTKIEHIDLPNNKKTLLDELGYQASDLLQSNYILWVEGLSDKIYFKKWIEEACPELKEGVHYSIMFYAGGNVRHVQLDKKDGHLIDLLDLSRNLGIFIDSDRINSTSEISKEKLKIKTDFEDKGLFCWITEKREIENYISHETYLEAVKSVHKVENIDIELGDYVCKTKFKRVDDKGNLQSKIRIPDAIFSAYQRDGDLSSIDARTLRKDLSKAFENSKKPASSNIDKINVAKEVTKSNISTDDPELKQKILELTKKIKIANNITD